MKTTCVTTGKTYEVTEKITQSHGFYTALGKTPEGKTCLIKWYIPYVDDESRFEECDEVEEFENDE